MRIGFFLFLCLLAVAGGLAWGVWEYRQQNPLPEKTVVEGLKEAAATVKKPDPVKPPDPGVKPPDPVVKPPDPVVKPPDPVDIRASDPVLVAIVEEGTRLYRDASFGAARKKFQQALSGRLSAEDRKRIEALSQNAALFQGLVDQVNPNDILPVDNRATIHLENGGEISGVLVREGSDYVEIRKDNGIVGRFSAIQIKRVEKQSKEEVLAALEKEYGHKLEALGSRPSGLDYYELAVFCIKNQLNAKVPSLLESAVKLDRNVMQAATETKAKMVYNLYQYFVKKGNRDAAEAKRRELVEKYPDSKYVKMLGGMTAKADPPKPVDPPKDPPKPTDPPKDPPKPTDPPKDPPKPTDPPEDPPHPVDPGAGTGSGDLSGQPPPRFSNPVVQGKVDKGNKFYDEGMTHLEKSFDDKNPDRDAENMKALDCFKKACAEYEAASELDPNNAWLNDRLRQAGENRVMCFIAAKKR